MPQMKDLVPSIGSSTQTYSASGRSAPNSSPMMPCSGKVCLIKRAHRRFGGAVGGRDRIEAAGTGSCSRRPARCERTAGWSRRRRPPAGRRRPQNRSPSSRVQSCGWGVGCRQPTTSGVLPIRHDRRTKSTCKPSRPVPFRADCPSFGHRTKAANCIDILSVFCDSPVCRLAAHANGKTSSAPFAGRNQGKIGQQHLSFVRRGVYCCSAVAMRFFSRYRRPPWAFPP